MSKKYYELLIFISLIAALYFGLGFGKVLFMRPQGLHQWAQCDRASIARNFAEEDLNIFKPRVHMTNEGSGITGCEFPFMNFLAAVFYKIFGFNEFWYRFLMLVAITAGVYFAMLLAKNYLRSFWLAIVIAVQWYNSPTLAYYSPNFIPDTASLGFTMIAWFFIFKYIKSLRKKDLYFWGVFLLLASLIKITSLLSVMAVAILLLLDKFNFFENRKFENRKTVVLLISGIFILTFAWYAYASWLNKVNNMSVFLMSNKTFGNKTELIQMLSGTNYLWVKFYYNNYYYYFIAASAVFLIFNFKKIDKILLVVFVSLFVGGIVFFFLMLAQFAVHDYYIITLLPLVFFYLLMLADVVMKYEKKSVVRIISVTVIVFMLFQTSIFSINHQKYRYNNWMFKSEKNYSAYFNLEKHLRRAGLKREDKVVSIYDNSPDVSLYLMNQKGWRINENEIDENIKKALNNCKYAIVNDTNFFSNKPQLKKYFLFPADTFKNLKIYKLINK
ncbi:MAG: glycosyltransferase family 39 protein [Bacteroidales bacterium]|nr:glycosyltransferase family 39 protein [Bacteroidales bacterium]